MLEVTLKLGNSTTQVIGKDAAMAIELLRDYLSTQDTTAAFFSKKKWDGTTFFITKKGEFQNGFVEDVWNYLKSEGFEVSSTEKSYLTRYVEYDPFRLAMLGHLDFELMPHQATALQSLEDQWYFPGSFDLAVNAGKTYLMAAMIDCMVGNPRVLVLVHDENLFGQHVEFFSKYWETGFVSGKKFKDGKVVVAKFKSLLNRCDEGDKAVLDWLDQCKCVFIDEAHRLAGNEYYNLVSQLPIFSKYCFSGSFDTIKDDKSNMRVRAIGGAILHKVTTQELEEAGVSAKIKVELYLCKAVPTLLSDKYLQIYDKAICLNGDRASKILYKCIESQNQNILITVDKVKHLQFLYGYLTGGDFGFEVYTLKGGQDPTEVRKIFNTEPDGVTRVLITTVLQEGANLRLDGMIYAQGGKGGTQLQQYKGRTHRLAGGSEKWIMDFWDNTPEVRGHSRNRIKLYRDQGCEIETKYEVLGKTLAPKF